MLFDKNLHQSLHQPYIVNVYKPSLFGFLKYLDQKGEFLAIDFFLVLTYISI